MTELIHRIAEALRVAGRELPQVVIETGTYRGDGTLALLTALRDSGGTPRAFHTVEKCTTWHRYARERFYDTPLVEVHLGDSQEVLPRLLMRYDEPCLLYLDAHYAGGKTADGSQPLLGELGIIATRAQKDVVIIDDVRLLGKAGTCGTMDDPVYPLMAYDWREMPQDRVAAFCGRDGWWEQVGDRLVLYRNWLTSWRPCDALDTATP